MPSQYITEIQNGANFEIRYNPLGTEDTIIINDGITSTSIPRGNNNFDTVLEYIELNNLTPEVEFSWVQVITDKQGNTLFFRTDKGDFTDNEENLISRIIKERIENETLELREIEDYAIPQELEINIFLRRFFKLNEYGPSPISEYLFNSHELGLPFSVEIRLIQEIEPDFFLSNEWMAQYLKYTKGNVIRIYVNVSNIKSIYNWCRAHLDQEEQQILNESLKIDLALFKRKSSHGPRTAWYFEWINLQDYIWVLIVQISNRIIDLVNLQAHRKTISLISRDDLSETVCIKAIKQQDEHYLWLIASLQDQQIAIFPKDLNWQHNMLDLAFYRVRFLIDQGLYFEAIVVAQAILESIVNDLFPTEVTVALFNKKEIKWEQKYKYLKEFYKHHLRDNSILYSYFDGGLKRIYKYRNKYSHDVLFHRPTYLFDIKTFQEISSLIKPFTDYFKNSLLMGEVSRVYELKNEFLDWLISKNMKPTDTLTTLFSHHLWANLRLLERCAALTDEQLEATMIGAYGSIQATLQHIVRAERSYFSRISTGQPYQHPADAPPMTIAEMVEAMRTTGVGLIEWAAKVQAGDTVQIDWEGTPRDVPKAIILTQAINHATEHRAQIMTILTQLGIEPPDLDGWSYFDEMEK